MRSKNRFTHVADPDGALRLAGQAEGHVRPRSRRHLHRTSIATTCTWSPLPSSTTSTRRPGLPRTCLDRRSPCRAALRAPPLPLEGAPQSRRRRCV